MSRIGYADESEYADRTETLAAIEAGRGWVPNVFRTMLVSPDVTGGWVALANAVRRCSTLDLRTRELVILLVAGLHESAYEWAHHAVLARRAGVTEAQLARLARPADGRWDDLRDDTWDAGDRAVLAVAAATATRTEVPQWCLDHLLTARGRRFVVDLTVTASYYVAVAHFTHALAVEPDTDAPRPEARRDVEHPPGTGTADP